jgi:hypothetical protein
MPACGRQTLSSFSIILRAFHLKFKIKDVLNKGILYLARAQFFLHFARGMGRRLFKVSRGQAPDGPGCQPSPLREFLSVIGNILLNPKAVLADEASPRDSPMPGYVFVTFSLLDSCKNGGWASAVYPLISRRKEFILTS